MSVDQTEVALGMQGIPLHLTGFNTNWANGVSHVTFPGEPGIAVVSQDFPSTTQGVVVLDVSWSVEPGDKILRVTTFGQVVETTISAVVAQRVLLQPPRVRRGEPGQAVRLQGVQTHFTQPGFSVSINPASGLSGVSVSWVVVGDRTADLTLDVGMAALEGTYADAVVVHTDSKDFFADLTVMAVQGRYVEVLPSEVTAGEAVVLRVAGSKTDFDTATFSITFDPADDILVQGTPVVVSATVAEVVVWVSAGAAPGQRFVTVTDQWGPLSAKLRVLLDQTPPSLMLDPAGAPLRWDGTVSAIGTNTSFAAGVTQVEVRCPTPGSPLGFVVDYVIDQTEVILQPSIPIDAPIEACEVWLITGPELAMAYFSVQALPEPSITISPTEGHQGESVVVEVTGTNTHFSLVPGEETTPVLDGPATVGVTVTDFVVADAGHATVILAIADDAVLGLDALTLRMKTPSWNEVPEAGFTVLAGIPEVTLFPSGLEQGEVGAVVQATGRFTSWVD
ncbi:MAG: hypothetical protein RBU30_20310, partial [Polyangia bacterium]|nr:hypothetical protein [Polyangia bacterium]